MVLKGVKCHHIWRVLRWVNVHHFTNFSQMVLKGVSLCCYIACCLDSGCPICVVWDVLLLYLQLFPSALAAWGTLSWASWWTLLFCAPWWSLLCPWGSPWAAEGHWGCPLAAWLWVAGVGSLRLCRSCHHESFSLSMAGFSSEMKLKAYFSAMSQFTVLALTQLSKVLKGINLLFVSSMVLKETCLVSLLSMVLKEIEVALLTSCSVSWKETFFLPDLPMVLKEVSLPLLLTMSLAVLASLMTLMLSTPRVLEGVDLCLSCFLLPHVSLAGVLKGVSVHMHIAMVLKELDGWSWKDLDVTLWFCSDVLPSIFKNGLERNLWSWCLSHFLQ